MSSGAAPLPLISESTPQTFAVTRPLWFAATAALLLVVFCVEMYLSVRTESQTFDEPAHLYAGYAYWLRGDFGVNPEHPPLPKLLAALPALLIDHPKFSEPVDIYFRVVGYIGGIPMISGPDGEKLLSHARAAMASLAVLLAVVVVLAAWEMFGRTTALFALALLVFDPLIIAHGPLVTTDIAAALFVFATTYAFYRFAKRPTVVRLIVCGVACGLALASKHSAIFLCPMLICLAVCEVGLVRRRDPVDTASAADPKGMRAWLKMGVSLLGVALLALTILWAFYGFHYAARPNGKSIIPPTAEYLKQLNHPAEAAGIRISERYHLLPESFLYGLTDIVIASRDGRVMNLFGKAYPHGRWFYFPMAMLIKCTLALLLLLLLLPFARGFWRRDHMREIVFLIVPPAAFLGWAMTSNLDIGIRHVLPVFPYLMVLAAAGAVSLAQRSRAWTWAVCGLLLLHAASSLRAAPNYLPYSNEAFGGPNNTWRSLADSNVGWASGLKALHHYVQEKQIKDCWFAYSGLPDPGSFGIQCKRLPTFFTFIGGLPPQKPVPDVLSGPVFVSSEEIDGAMWGPPELNPYRSLLRTQPSHVIAGEILEYDGTFSAPEVAAFSHAVAALSELDPKAAGPPDALRDAQAAVALDPTSLIAYEALTFAYAANGKKDEALRAYETSVHLYNTIHPEFQADENPPVNPFAAPAGH
jgi:4-amino-4-deoxy-L-arabinose transferase-like glycosyltransferase